MTRFKAAAVGALAIALAAAPVASALANGNGWHHHGHRHYYGNPLSSRRRTGGCRGRHRGRDRDAALRRSWAPPPRMRPPTMRRALRRRITIRSRDTGNGAPGYAAPPAYYPPPAAAYHVPPSVSYSYAPRAPSYYPPRPARYAENDGYRGNRGYPSSVGLLCAGRRSERCLLRAPAEIVRKPVCRLFVLLAQSALRQSTPTRFARAPDVPPAPRRKAAPLPKRKPAAPTPRRGGRPSREDAAQLHDRILDAATDLFFQRGYGATSIEAVAEHARISKRTFYHRYADKATLFGAVLHRIIEGLRPPAAMPAHRRRGPPGNPAPARKPHPSRRAHAPGAGAAPAHRRRVRALSQAGRRGHERGRDAGSDRAHRRSSLARSPRG